MTTTFDTQHDTLRQKALETSKHYKAFWIELGQYLFSIYKDKHYKDWGYLAFETYCRKELGIKESTAAKLLKSYSFLEKEEPKIIKPDYSEEAAPQSIPHYENVNLLRLAKNNKNIPAEDFADLRKTVLTTDREPKEIRSQIKKIVEANAPREDVEETRKSKRASALKRLITTLNRTKEELASEKLVPAYLLKQIEDLAQKLADQISE